MTSLFRRFMFTLLGIALAIFGVYHATTSYPEPKAFALVSRELPTIGAVASFYSGIAIAVLGLALLVPIIWHLRRSQSRKLPAFSGRGGFRPRPDRGDEDCDFEPDDDPYQPEPNDDHDRGRRAGYDPYRGSYGMAGGRDGRALATDRRG